MARNWLGVEMNSEEWGADPDSIGPLTPRGDIIDEGDDSWEDINIPARRRAKRGGRAQKGLPAGEFLPGDPPAESYYAIRHGGRESIPDAERT